MKEAEMDKIAEFIERVLKICVKIQETSGKKLVDFIAAVEKCEEIKDLTKEVHEFSSKFYLPGKFL